MQVLPDNIRLWITNASTLKQNFVVVKLLNDWALRECRLASVVGNRSFIALDWQGFVQKWVNTFKVSTHQRDLHRRVMRSLIGEPLEENFSPPQCDNKHPAKRLLNSWRYFRCDDFKNRNSLSIYLVYYKREGKQKYNIIYKQISSDDVSKIATTENPPSASLHYVETFPLREREIKIAADRKNISVKETEGVWENFPEEQVVDCFLYINTWITHTPSPLPV